MHGGDRFKDGGQKSLEVICLQASVHQVHPLQSFDASGKIFCNIFGIEDQISAPRASQQKKVQRKSAELIKQTAANMFSNEDERRESTCTRGLDWFVEETQKRG